MRNLRRDWNPPNNPPRPDRHVYTDEAGHTWRRCYRCGQRLTDNRLNCDPCIDRDAIAYAVRLIAGGRREAALRHLAATVTRQAAREGIDATIPAPSNPDGWRPDLDADTTCGHRMFHEEDRFTVLLTCTRPAGHRHGHAYQSAWAPDRHDQEAS